MYNDSRTDIYDYLYSLVYNVVTKNVYRMGEPTETTDDDVKNGFVVLEVGNFNDDSEFIYNAYGWVRCFITAYVPKKTRGRMDKDKYKAFETSINTVVNNAITSGQTPMYSILSDGVVSMDDDSKTQKGNQYHMYIKSFIVTIDEPIPVITNNNNT